MSDTDHRNIEDRLACARRGVESRVRRDVLKALVSLYTFIPETRSPPRGAGRGPLIPFVSEAWLYTHLGKEDARTFFALLRNIEEAVGLDTLDVRHAIMTWFQRAKERE